MNRVSSAVGSKLLTTSLLPSSSRLAAVKPEPVSSLKRLSASATALTSAGLNWCLVSPVWSITICVAMVSLTPVRKADGNSADRLKFHCHGVTCIVTRQDVDCRNTAGAARSPHLSGRQACGSNSRWARAGGVVTTPRNGPVLCSTSPPHAQRDSSHLCEDQRSDRNRGPYDPPVVLAQIIHDVVSPARGPVKCGSDEKHPGARRVFVGRAAPPFMQAIPFTTQYLSRIAGGRRIFPNVATRVATPTFRQPSTPK
jgi:hypothetical protein